MKLSEYLKSINSDTDVSVSLSNSLWHEDFELMYHASYVGKAKTVPAKYMDCEVVKTFTSFMWGTLAIIIDGLP